MPPRSPLPRHLPEDDAPRDHYPVPTRAHTATLKRLDQPVLDDTDHKVRVKFETDIHENYEHSRLTISGVGPGAHRAHLLLVDTNSARVIEEPTWDGDTTVLHLAYIPTSVIANVDGSDEIRFDITRKD